MKSISIEEDRFWELEEMEKEYRALKALLLLFGDEEPEKAIDLMRQTVRYAEHRKKEREQKEEVWHVGV